MNKKFNELFFPHDHKPGHFKALDGLRGIAVLLVLLSHSSNMNVFIHPYFNFAKIGKVGVFLFFVLSAYLLDRQIALAFMSGKSSKMYWKNYFLRRFLRIYPLFVVSLTIHGLFTYFGATTVIDRLIDLPLHMSLIRGESIFWSIPVEFKYYFISPLIMWFFHKVLAWDRMKLLISFLIMISGTIIIELIFKLPIISTLKYFPIFLVGTLLSIYEITENKKLSKSDYSSLLNILGLLAGSIIFISIPFYFEKIFGFEFNIHSSAYYFPYSVLWGIILVSAKYGKGLVKGFLELKFLRFIGTISFSMYLFHMLFLITVKNLDISSPARFILFFALCTLFSSITYLLIELPLSKIRIYKSELSEKDVIKEKIGL